MNQAQPGSDARDYEGLSLGEQLESVIGRLPTDRVTLGEMLDVFGDEGLLLLSMLLTLVFLIPVSIPGVSTVFGAAILLVGISRVLRRPLWLPSQLRTRSLPADKLRPGLVAGMKWVRRLEAISRPRRLPWFVEGVGMDLFNNLAFVFAALLLMMPFGFVPFSNTLPALALLLYGLGFVQRDGGAIVSGHLAAIGTTIYFTVLIAGGGYAAFEIFRRFTG